MSDRWDAPDTTITDVDVAFPARALEFMPSREVCEAGLKDLPDNGKAWRLFQRKWFYDGLSPETEFEMQGDIDPTAAFKHLACIQGSYASQHEHKEAAVAFLASRWFVAPPAVPPSADEDTSAP